MEAKGEFRSAHLLSGEAILALGVSRNDVELYRRMHYQKSFSISSWYTEAMPPPLSQQLYALPLPAHCKMPVTASRTTRTLWLLWPRR